MKKNFYWFACFACATVALAFSSCNDDKIEPDIDPPFFKHDNQKESHACSRKAQPHEPTGG